MPQKRVKQQDKAPPQAINLEKAVLGILLSDFNKYHGAKNYLYEDIFYTDKYKVLFRVILETNKKGLWVDIVSVAQTGKEMNLLDKMPLLHEIATLINTASHHENLEKFARKLIEYDMLRKIIEMNMRLISEAYEPSADPFEIIDKCTSEATKLIPVNAESSQLHFNETIDMTLAMFGESKPIKTFYEIGDTNWDNYVAFTKGLSIIAGASGIGKTTFTVWLLFKLLKVHNKNVSIFWIINDHETPDSILRKIISQRTGMSDKEIVKSGNALQHVYLSLKKEMNDYDILFETNRKYISEYCKDFKKFCATRKNRFCIMVLDNLMRTNDRMVKSIGSTEKDEHAVNQLSDTYRSIGNCQIIMLHHFSKDQLSKENEAGAYRPTVSHLKGSQDISGVFEQVLLLNRPGAYQRLIDRYPKPLRGILNRMFVVEVAKNTNGPLGIIHYLHDIEHCNFKEI